MQDIHVLPWLGLREPFNVFSHAIGAVVFAYLAVRLIARVQGDPLRKWGLFVLAYTSVQTLVCSSIYHMCWPGPTRNILLAVDIAGIFLLIAGSITPVHLILFTGPWRWIPPILAWTVGISGAVFKLTYSLHDVGQLNTIMFLIIGWGNAITVYKVWRRHGWEFLQYAVYAGMSYTIGAVILIFHKLYLIRGVVGPHEIWHVAVLCALAFQWRFVFQITAFQPEPVVLRIAEFVEEPAFETVRRAA